MNAKLNKVFYHTNAFGIKYIVIPTKTLSNNKIHCLTYRGDINLWQTSIASKRLRISKTKFKDNVLKKAIKSVFHTNWEELL